ncbi:helix-turn-helix domain-containing protein [Corynebacterium poyangense]|uniref:Helix-turn-helix domain-containing protein n=1 Tax=Corynebacterium poyangense TaxID=2684405 RepID=A0A7H0SLD6_9CORY|nr:IclR family transcriptional regulator [Corynebacterium poyangense]MBZ8177453.1 helix-turn-helix domain-containing protein [Corynebacterium poyangense]QNQ89361.1 helix-turn-helix domain-containing protein [Corynebacterium poyangense]
MTQNTSRSSKVPAAQHTLAILKLLTAVDAPMSAARIVQETRIPRSTVYHLLAVMEEAGFVVHLHQEKAYGLGLAAYEMANAYSRQQPLARVGLRFARQLALQVQGSAHISCLSGSEVLYLLEERAPNGVRLLTDAGVRLEALRTASGKAMLAFRSSAEIKAAVGVCGVGGQKYRDVERELEEIRDRGWATEYAQVSPGQESIAVPIFDHLGRAASALAVTFSIGSLDRRNIAELIEEVRESAAKIAIAVYRTRPK